MLTSSSRFSASDKARLMLNKSSSVWIEKYLVALLDQFFSRTSVQALSTGTPTSFPAIVNDKCKFPSALIASLHCSSLFLLLALHKAIKSLLLFAASCRVRELKF